MIYSATRSIRKEVSLQSQEPLARWYLLLPIVIVGLIFTNRQTQQQRRNWRKGTKTSVHGLNPAPPHNICLSQNMPNDTSRSVFPMHVQYDLIDLLYLLLSVLL